LRCASRPTASTPWPAPYTPRPSSKSNSSNFRRASPWRACQPRLSPQSQWRNLQLRAARCPLRQSPNAAEATDAAVDFGQDDDISVLTLTRLASGARSTTELITQICAGLNRKAARQLVCKPPAASPHLEYNCAPVLTIKPGSKGLNRDPAGIRFGFDRDLRKD
jgi:hypothetical protein